MTKRMWFLTFFLSVVLAGGILLQGCKDKEKMAQAPEAPAQLTEPARMAGEVVSVNAQANTVVVKSEQGAEQTFAIDPATTIIMEGSETLTLAELAVGTKVEVEYETGTDGRLTATAITIER